MGISHSPDISFSPLKKNHNRIDFSCGDAALGQYLQHQATQDIKRNVTACTVCIGNDGKTILGYYTLSATSVPLSNIPHTILKKLPRYPNVPATLLGRLAVSKKHQGVGLGRLLLMHAMEQSLLVSQKVASFAIMVDAKNEKAASFYKLYGFIPFIDQPHQLFLPMKTIERLMG